MLSQEAYTEKLIEKYKMGDCRTLEAPLDVSSTISQLESPKIGSKEYKDMQSCDYTGIVGCLNYLALAASPDSAHTTTILISVVENPRNKHWNVPKACLRSLKGTKPEKLISWKCDKLDLKVFSDSDRANNLDSRKNYKWSLFQA